jgi:hypothetical protein
MAEVQNFGERIHARLEVPGAGAGPDRALAAVRSALDRPGIEVTGIRSIQASLEDVFINRVMEAKAVRS